MATLKIKVLEVHDIPNFDKGCNVHFSIEGKESTFIAKAWKDPVWTVGQSYDVTTEKKSRSGRADEDWINQPRRSGGGGGGKTDPAKLALERERLDHEKAKSQNYQQSDFDRQVNIMAQFCVNRGVELECANISKAKAETVADMNRVSQYAKDVVDLLPELQDQIATSLKARQDNRQ